uniref:Protein kinase domain-containing protein n=2 Tax=Caenorhabditis japonica TaxID=281687 RepID=A0A8R1DFP0_CAEJA
MAAAPPPGGKDAPQKELIRAQNATYEVTKPLATGTFGSIYKAKRESDGKFFAVKCESLNLKNSLLRQMSIVLASLHYPSPFFATIEERGTVPNRFLFVVMPLYGDNLCDLMHNANRDRKFSMASGLHLAEQTLTAIRDLHRNGFIHRDIKPTHFCIGRESEDQHHNVFLLDFGLCKRPRFAKKNDEAEEQIRKNAILYRGVVKYASVAAHQCKNLGYKDDMESWWYMCLEFFLGALPWALLNKESEQDVLHLKKRITAQMVASVWKSSPETISGFFELLSIIRDPKDVAEFVDYDRIADCISKLFEKSKANPQEPPDWDCMNDYKGASYQQVPMIAPPEVALKNDQDFGKNDPGPSAATPEAPKKGKKKSKGKKKKGKKGNSVSVDENEQASKMRDVQL